MAFEKVCQEEDIPVGGKKRFKVNGRGVLVFHLADGFYATAANCTHVFAPLQGGKLVDDCLIQCPIHRAQFDIKTGEVKKWASFPPVIADLLNIFRKKKALASFPVKVEGGEVRVEVS